MIHPYLGFVTPPLPEDLAGGVYFGFPRSPDPLQARSPERVIFAILGGSVAAYFWDEGASEFRKTVESSALFRDKELVFVRVARGGYKQPQQLMALAYFLGLGAQWDYVVNLDGFNEVTVHFTANPHREVSPIYPRAWKLMVQDRPGPEELRLIARVDTAQRRRRDLAAFMQGFPWSYSPTANLLWVVADRRLNGQQAAAEMKLQQTSVTGDPSATAEIRGPQVGLRNKAETFDYLVGLWRQCSLQMHRLCEANGIRYFHFLQPNQYVPGSKTLTDEERRTAYREEGEHAVHVRRGYPKLIEAGQELRAAGVRFFDLTGVFADETGTIYRDVCCHVNVRGNDILGRAIAQAILADLESPRPADK